MASETCSHRQCSRFARQNDETMTTESSTDGATTLSPMNLSGYVGPVTIFSWMLTIYCMPFSSRVRVRVKVKFSSGWFLVIYLFNMKKVQKYTITKKQNKKYIHHCKRKNWTIKSISSLRTKQSLRTIAVMHAEQFCQHTDYIKNRGWQAAIILF